MTRYALFTDRDGTLNYDPGYLGDPDSVKLYPGVIQGIKTLKSQLNFKVIVISNQSGITRNLISSDQVDQVNRRINDILNVAGTSIDAFYFCPFHPDFDPPEKCKCRKPSPELVLKAVQEHQIDLSKSYFIGDSQVDIECGYNSGLKTILIRNTLDEVEIKGLQKQINSPNFVADNFLEGIQFIINDFLGEN